jgi:transposase, IS30 family
LSSSRRVKKGPGRRPQSAKRQRFVELRERGWSILATAREVGVSRTTGNNWSRGYKTYRLGQVVGFVSALERLAVRDISPRFLSQDERIEIAELRHAGLSIRQIAHRLGRAPSTVSRELRRNATGSRGYRPFDAHRRATARRARNHRRRIEANGELRQLVAELLAQRWSPQQISRHLRLKFPEQSGMWLCHESIYQALYQAGSTLLRPSRLAPHHRSPLRTGEITGALISAPNAVGRGLSIRCSRFINGPSRPRTGPSRGTGNLNVVVKPPERAGVALLSRFGSRGAAPKGRRSGGGRGR